MLRTRIEQLERKSRGGRPPEVVYVVPDHPDRGAHTPEVRRIGALPNGYLVCFQEVGGADPLAALLGPNDPVTLRHRGPGITIRRSYGLDPV